MFRRNLRVPFDIGYRRSPPEAVQLQVSLQRRLDVYLAHPWLGNEDRTKTPGLPLAPTPWHTALLSSTTPRGDQKDQFTPVSRR